MLNTFKVPIPEHFRSCPFSFSKIIDDDIASLIGKQSYRRFHAGTIGTDVEDSKSSWMYSAMEPWVKAEAFSKQGPYFSGLMVVTTNHQLAVTASTDIIHKVWIARSRILDLNFAREWDSFQKRDRTSPVTSHEPSLGTRWCSRSRMNNTTLRDPSWVFLWPVGGETDVTDALSPLSGPVPSVQKVYFESWPAGGRTL